METFGQRLRRARKAKGWTQERVARELRVDRTTYCKYETGKVEPPITLCFHLCVVLGLTPNALMGWEEAPPVMEKEAQAALQEKWPEDFIDDPDWDFAEAIKKFLLEGETE